MNLKRLRISKRVVGRDLEIAELHEMYCHVRDKQRPTSIVSSTGSSHMAKARCSCVFVKGISGTGKSTLIREAFEGVLSNDNVGYFCEGKYDLMSAADRPFSALVDALSSLCSKVMKGNGSDINQFERLQNLLRQDEGAALSSLMPNLAHFLQVRNDVNASSTSLGSVNGGSPASGRSPQSLKHTFFRLKTVVKKLIQEMVADKVLILFIDDLQWADMENIDLIDYLVANLNPTKLLFIGGFRSDAIDDDHYLSKQFLQREDIKRPVIIELHEVTFEAVGVFIADTLSLTEEEVQPLTELVFKRTKGNMFFVKSYLDSLHNYGHLYFSLQKYRWEWEDLANVDACQGNGEEQYFDIKAIVSKKILRMPKDTVQALKLASCVGGRFDVEVIDYLVKRWNERNRDESFPLHMEQKPIEEVLWQAVDEGLLEEVCQDPLSVTKTLQYKFTHDRIKLAAYSIIGAKIKQYHLAVGTDIRDLFEKSVNTPKEGKSWMLLLAADHLYKAKNLLSTQSERDSVAELCYTAAQELESNSAFISAAKHLRNSIDLLGDLGWQRDYALTLKVYTLNAEMEYCAGNQDECDKRTKEILDSAKTLSDKQSAFFVSMASLGMRGRHEEAFDIGYSLLKKMKFSRFSGIFVPKINILAEVATALRAAKKYTDEQLLTLPESKDETLALFMKALMSTLVSAWIGGKQEKFVFFGLRTLKISLQHGYTPHTPPSFAIAAVVCGLMGKYQEAKRLGQIGLRLTERFGNPYIDAMTYVIYYGSIHPLFFPYSGCHEGFRKAQTLARHTGNVFMACMAAACTLSASLTLGTERWDSILSRASRVRDEVAMYNNFTMVPLVQMYRQFALNLTGRNANGPRKLEGEAIPDLARFVVEGGLSPYVQRIGVFLSMMLAYHFGDLNQARQDALRNAKAWKRDHAMHYALLMPFFRGLVWCRLFLRHGVSSYKRRAKNELQILQGFVNAGLANRKMLALLLEAEIEATMNPKNPHRIVRAIYDRGIAVCTAEKFDFLAALGLELAGTYLASRHKDLAMRYIGRAIESYKTLKVVAKERDLRIRFGDLLGDQMPNLSSTSLSLE